MIVTLINLISLLICYGADDILTDTDGSICFGSLTLDIPVRYLHIQLTSHGWNVTRSIGALAISFKEHCRYRWEIIDNFDGSYVLRIRLWSECPRLTVTIKTRVGVPLCSSPLTIEKGDGMPLFAESCRCPIGSINEWMQIAKCPKHYSQLESDLSQWSSVDFKEVHKRVQAKWAHRSQRYSSSLCHYQIIENEIYRRCYGEYTGFSQFVDRMLLSIRRKMYLPNTEFYFNLGDWPLETDLTNGTPIVSWCGSNDSRDIVMPTYELSQSVLGAMESLTLDIHTAKGSMHVPWTEKKTTAVFRGRDSSQLRLDIALLAQNRPDLLEGGITRYFFFDESANPPRVKHVPFSEFFKHRYVISTDGTVAAYRFPFLLAGDSVILKSNSPYYEHFYSELQSNLHYIPFTNVTDLTSKIIWARQEDFNETLKHMRQFVYDHLQPVHTYCYYAQFLEKYTKLLREIPKKVARGMDHISFETEVQGCSCPTLPKSSNQSEEGARIRSDL